MKRNILFIVLGVIAVTGAVFAIDKARTPEAVETPDHTQNPTPSGWQTMEVSGVEFQIPPGYTMDAGAGQRYVVKDDPNNPSPTPDMHISSDGEQVNFRRWENHAWQYWDQVIASIHVRTPMTHNLQINIDK